MNDMRYLSIKSRLDKLPSEFIQRFLDFTGTVCYDTYNYNEQDNSYCPIAIMLKVPNKLLQDNVTPNQEETLRYIKNISNLIKGFEFGTVKGIPGQFYTNNRESDLKELCRSILNERCD